MAPRCNGSIRSLDPLRCRLPAETSGTHSPRRLRREPSRSYPARPLVRPAQKDRVRASAPVPLGPHHQEVARSHDPSRRQAQGGQEPGGRFTWPGRHGGRIQHKTASFARDRQQPAAGMDADRPSDVSPQGEDMHGGQSGVPAQVILDHGSEPAQVKIPIRQGTTKAVSLCLFSAARLCMTLSARKAGKRQTPAGISRRRVRLHERVYVVIRDLHGVLPGPGGPGSAPDAHSTRARSGRFSTGRTSPWRP
jgi:hypothetical protein